MCNDEAIPKQTMIMIRQAKEGSPHLAASRLVSSRKIVEIDNANGAAEIGHLPSHNLHKKSVWI